MRRWDIGNAAPEATTLREIADALLAGGVLVLPTDTLYGLHACAADAAAIGRIYATKERGDTRPLLVLCANAEQLRSIGAAVPEDVAQRLDRIWPAPLTAIVPLEHPIPPSAGGATIGARVPDLPWLRELCGLTGPIASTSVNRSGAAPLTDPADIPPDIAQAIDGIVVAGILAGNASTVVDFTEDPPRLVRDGAFFFSQNLWKSLWKTL